MIKMTLDLIYPWTKWIIDYFNELMGTPEARPLLACLLYSILAICVIDGMRMVARGYYTWRNNPEGFAYWNEFFSVLIICTFTFQEAVICDNYGHLAMFVMIFIHQAIAQYKNQGGGLNACLLFEEWAQQRLAKESLMWIGGIHYVAATMACRFSDVCWYNTFKMSELTVPHKDCLYNETVPMPISMLVQFIGAFICRACFVALSPPNRRRWIPLLYATLMTGSHYITGVVGIQPMVAASLLANCILVQQEAAVKYGLIYLGSISSGWLFSALITQTEMPLRSIWRQKFEAANNVPMEQQKEENEAASPEPSPQFREVGRGVNRRKIPLPLQNPPEKRGGRRGH